MCIAFFALLEPSEAQGLTFCLAFNRDEYLARPTEPAHFWPAQPHILAGRDLEFGGTWLGIGTNGRIAFLTNLRQLDNDPDVVAAEGHAYHSRGELPLQFINSRASPTAFLQALDGSLYHGYNLVCIDLPARAMAYANNMHSGRGRALCVAGQPAAAPSGGAQQHAAAAAAAAPGSGSTQTPGKTQPGGQPAAAAAQPDPAADAVGMSRAACAPEPDMACARGSPQPGLAPASQLGSHASQGIEVLQAGVVYGVSNGVLNEWSKVDSGRPAVQALLAGAGRPPPLPVESHEAASDHDEASALCRSLMDAVMGDSRREEDLRPVDPDGQALPDGQLNLEDHLEYVASGRFVLPVVSKHGLYCTRSQTVLLVWANGTAMAQERVLDAGSMQWRTQQHIFRMQGLGT